jgi:hypothetical protein
LGKLGITIDPAVIPGASISRPICNMTTDQTSVFFVFNGKEVSGSSLVSASLCICWCVLVNDVKWFNINMRHLQSSKELFNLQAVWGNWHWKLILRCHCRVHKGKDNFKTLALIPDMTETRRV